MERLATAARLLRLELDPNSKATERENRSEIMSIIQQARKNSTVGVLLMARGTLAGSGDIEAYYTRMRAGRPPTLELLSDLQYRYAAIGCRSPLLECTRAQVRGLQAALDQTDPGRFNVTLGMQYSHPFIEDGVAELVASGVQQIVGLVLAPHYSFLSVGAYSKQLKAANASSLPLSVIEHWHLAPSYLDFLETSLQATLEQMICKQGVMPTTLRYSLLLTVFQCVFLR